MGLNGIYLGTLCRRGHNYQNTGKSLRYLHGHCIDCYKKSRSIRLGDPIKNQHETNLRKIREFKRRPPKGRNKISDDQRRERGRVSRLEKYHKFHEYSKSYARDYYRRNSLKIRLRNRISKALRQQKVGKILTVAEYGIDVSAIARKIGKCPGNPTDWHVDHIKPLSLFDLSDNKQLLEAFSPQNHQWLPAKDNLIKGSKYAPGG